MKEINDLIEMHSLLGINYSQGRSYGSVNINQKN